MVSNDLANPANANQRALVPSTERFLQYGFVQYRAWPGTRSKEDPGGPKGYQGLMRRMGTGVGGTGGTPPGVRSKKRANWRDVPLFEYCFRRSVRARPGLAQPRHAFRLRAQYGRPIPPTAGRFSSTG